MRLGTDVLGEQFALVENDTLDVSTEGRIGFDLTWRPHSNFSLSNQLSIGTEYVRDAVNLSTTAQAAERWSLRGNIDLALRKYHGQESNSRSDVGTGGLYLQAIGTASKNLSLGFSSKLLATAYSQPSSYLRNAWQHIQELRADWTPGWRIWQFRTAFVQEVVPDSAGLGYLALRGSLYGELPVNQPWRITLDGTAERRNYWDRALRPSVSEVSLSTQISRSLGDSPSLEAYAQGRITSYEPADSIYASVNFIALAMNFNWWTERFTLRFGPTLEIQRSPTTSGENFLQWSANIGGDISSTAHGLTSLDLSAGRRNYEDEEASFYTDYTFCKMSLLASLSLYGTDFNTLLDLRHEIHSDATDDTTILLLTLDISRAIWKNAGRITTNALNPQRKNIFLPAP